jgi:drug/metabolite transporter (DMT)-like permease
VAAGTLMLLVVLLSLIAAFLFAAAASVQQHAVRATAPAEPGTMPASEVARPLVILLPLLALARRLVRSRLWLLGWLTNLVGFLIQAAALKVGSVALVQPLLVTQLLFALPMASAWTRRWPLHRDWLAGLAISGGVAVFLSVRGTAPLRGEPDRWRVILAGVSAAGLVVLLLVAAIRRQPAVHAALVAVAAGLCFAMSAVLTKLTAEDLVHRGVAATAVDWVGYCLAASTLIGLVLEQDAFGAGSLATAVAAMTITNPLASYLIGVLAFHASPPTTPGALAAVAGAGLLLFVGVLGLAHSPTVHQEVAKVPTYEARESTPATRSP